MKIGNINKREEYPDNYDKMQDAYKNAILDFFADQQKRANDYYEEHITAETAEERSKLLGLYNHQLDVMIGAKLVLACIGIKMEYNWPGHKGEWIMATANDWDKDDSAVDVDCEPKSKLEKYAGWPKPRTNADNTRDKDLLPRMHGNFTMGSF